MPDDPRIPAYQTICTSYNALADWRAKLLGFLPLASGAGVFYLLNSSITGNPTIKNYFLPIGLVGAIVYLGLFFYDLRAIQIKDGMVKAGGAIERDLGMWNGPFGTRPHSFWHAINDVVGSCLIYLSIIAGWLYFGLVFTAPALAWKVAIAVFGAGAIVVFGSRRKRVEVPMSEANKQLAKRWFEEVWNKGRREVIDELLPKDCTIHEGEASIKGPQEFKAYFDRMQAIFSDTHIDIQEALSEGELVCLRWAVSVRHTGDGLGMPATGKLLRSTGISVIRIRDGRFVEAWQNWDMLGLMQQINDSKPATFYMAAG